MQSSLNSRHLRFPWEELSQLFTLLGILGLAATGALLAEAHRAGLWHSAGFSSLVAIVAAFTGLMLVLSMGSSALDGQQHKHH